MYCVNCGKYLPDDSVFCDQCGTPQSNANPASTHGSAEAPTVWADQQPYPVGPDPWAGGQYAEPANVQPAGNPVPYGAAIGQKKKFPTVGVVLSIVFMLLMIGCCILLIVDFNQNDYFTLLLNGENPPFTVKRIILGAAAAVGLFGALISLIVTAAAKRTAATVTVLVLFLISVLGSAGATAFSAIQHHVFDDPLSVSDRGTPSFERETQAVAVIPDCVGSNASQAKTDLENLGCIVTLEYRYSDSVESGAVISQSVRQGTKIENAMAVTLVVSKGKEVVATQPPTEKSTENAAAATPPEGYEQKLVVTAASGSSNATAEFYEWRNGKWEKLATYRAAVGANGIGYASEGSRTTPMGEFRLGVVISQYSINTNLNTYRATSSTCVIDDSDSPYYNQIMEVGSVPSGTHYDTIGNGLTNGTTYATIFIEHNGNGFSSSGVIPGRGSAIGVRGQYGSLSANYGDVDISADDMRDLLSRLDAAKNPMIIIRTK